MVGQPHPQERSQLTPQDLGTVLDDYIADQPRVGSNPMDRGHRMAHRLMCGQRRFDLAQFDAEPVHLHLLIHPAKVLQRPVAPPAHQIAGSVDTVTLDERTPNEALCVEVAALMVPARNPDAPNPQLSRCTRWHQRALLVDHIDPRVVNRPSNGNRPLGLLFHSMDRRRHRRFRRTVEIPDLVGALAQRRHEVQWECLPTTERLL